MARSPTSREVAASTPAAQATAENVARTTGAYTGGSRRRQTTTLRKEAPRAKKGVSTGRSSASTMTDWSPARVRSSAEYAPVPSWPLT